MRISTTLLKAKEYACEARTLLRTGVNRPSYMATDGRSLHLNYHRTQIQKRNQTRQNLLGHEMAHILGEWGDNNGGPWEGDYGGFANSPSIKPEEINAIIGTALEMASKSSDSKVEIDFFVNKDENMEPANKVTYKVSNANDSSNRDSKTVPLHDSTK